jgi:hypothetical protein
MTERRADRTVEGLRSRGLAMLMALAIGALVCACGSASGATTGTLKGTAAPCTGPTPNSKSQAWEVQVILRRGSTVIAKRTVFDTEAADEPVIDAIFSFTEPAGTYSVSGATPQEQTVVIKAGTTSTVDIPAICK